MTCGSLKTRGSQLATVLGKHNLVIAAQLHTLVFVIVRHPAKQVRHGVGPHQLLDRALECVQCTWHVWLKNHDLAFDGIGGETPPNRYPRAFLFGLLSLVAKPQWRNIPRTVAKQNAPEQTICALNKSLLRYRCCEHGGSKPPFRTSQ
jgi:hypothetical protein